MEGGPFFHFGAPAAGTATAFFLFIRLAVLAYSLYLFF